MTLSARNVLALLALALGGFGIGTTEFATMGLLPQIARGLLPGFDAAPQAGIATAGTLITAYAVGVVVGAPTIAVLASRFSQNRLALALLAALAVGNLATALAPTFGLAVASRFLAGLPHGAYFGVAALLASRLLGPGRQGTGIALAMSGLTVANIVGVPFGTWVGQSFGWQWAYVLVAGIFLVTLALAVPTLPRVPADRTRTARDELAAFASGRLWLMVGVAAIGFSGFFAVYTYVSETATRAAGLPLAAVPFVLMTVGVGMTIGNLLGGWLSDRDAGRTVFLGFAALVAVLAGYAALAGTRVGIFVMAFALALVNSMIIPAIQSRLIDIAGDAQLLGAALNHSAFNVGNALGAALGGAVIAAGLGYLAPAWVAAAMTLVGMGLCALSFRLGVGPRPRGADAVEREPVGA